jgi:CheY-like chemotaxis protein
LHPCNTGVQRGDPRELRHQGFQPGFNFRLPGHYLVAARPSPVMDDPITMDSVQRARILVVDDEPEVTNCLRRLLRRHFEVEVATSGEEALEKLERFDPDVVISDYRMAKMSGRDLLRQVRERQPDALRVLMSGWAEPQAIESSVRDRTANRVLAKPFPPDDLVSAIREFLAERARGASLRESGSDSHLGKAAHAEQIREGAAVG